jgi:hypothetical protein
MDRTFKEWFYFILGYRQWEYQGQVSYYILDKDQYKIGHFLHTKFHCEKSNTDKAIISDVTYYDEPK